jgi:hypothetical protein
MTGLKYRRSGLLLAIAISVICLMLASRTPARAVEPSDLETGLKVSIGGVEKSLTLPEAMAELNVASGSLAVRISAIRPISSCFLSRERAW